MPETIETDGKRLRQVLISVIGNAVKFTESASIHVACKLDEAPDPASFGDDYV